MIKASYNKNEKGKSNKDLVSAWTKIVVVGTMRKRKIETYLRGKNHIWMFDMGDQMGNVTINQNREQKMRSGLEEKEEKFFGGHDNCKVLVEFSFICSTNNQGINTYYVPGRNVQQAVGNTFLEFGREF